MQSLRESRVLHGPLADVAVFRERSRRRRLGRLAALGALVCLWMWQRILAGDPLLVRPHLSDDLTQMAPLLLLVVVMTAVLLVPLLGAGRSPHVLFRSSEISTTLDDVKGAPVLVEEVVKTLNLFLAHKTFKERMGGTPRRAILFEGPPGTGKTYMAKAMAHEAAVPFLFVSSSAFQSMYYGQTNRKIRSYFKALRKAARREGGAIGLAQPVEYTDAERRIIATHESGHATVAWLVGKSRKLEVLSIIKRKLALGLLAHSDREERFLQSQSEMHGLIQIALGGLVAEELYFGEISSGPSGDLKAATTLAAQMIGSLGMAGSLFSYEAMHRPNTDIVTRVTSGDDGKAAIEQMLDTARAEVRVMLAEHHAVVEALRDALLERHELIGDEILEVIHHAVDTPVLSALV